MSAEWLGELETIEAQLNTYLAAFLQILFLIEIHPQSRTAIFDEGPGWCELAWEDPIARSNVRCTKVETSIATVLVWKAVGIRQLSGLLLRSWVPAHITP